MNDGLQISHDTVILEALRDALYKYSTTTTTTTNITRCGNKDCPFYSFIFAIVRLRFTLINFATKWQQNFPPLLVDAFVSYLVKFNAYDSLLRTHKYAD